MSFEYIFSKWLALVDAYVWALAGCSMWDLADCPWNDWHADRIAPKTAAKRAIEEVNNG